MKERGLAAFALSTEAPEDLVAIERRLGGRITFLSDREGTTLDALGLRHPKGMPRADALLLGLERRDIPYPATLLVGVDGRIRYLRRARRIDERPPVAELLAANPKPRAA